MRQRYGRVALCLGITAVWVCADARADILNVPGQFPTIQAAIDAAVDGDEVHVADGLYTGLGNRDLDFGGRLIIVRSVSGDPMLCVIDCQGSAGDPHRGFYFHTNETAAAVVDGFTITGGHVTTASPGGNNGGGIYVENCTPTIANCIIESNVATGNGGGVFNVLQGATIRACVIRDNSALAGGGMANLTCNPGVLNCLFIGNEAVGAGKSGGAGMSNQAASPAIVNCTFTQNAAFFSIGGAMQNTTLSNPAVTNCILWNNFPDAVASDIFSAPVVSYSDVQGGFTGPGNIDVDPGFVDAPVGDVHLNAGSPCIDAANNLAVPVGTETDLDGNPRFVDDPDVPDTGVPDGVHPIVDMGAYEVQGPVCAGDTNGDNVVDVHDLLDVLGKWGPCAGCPADIDGDGFVDKTDLVLLIIGWGACG